MKPNKTKSYLRRSIFLLIAALAWEIGVASFFNPIDAFQKSLVIILMGLALVPFFLSIKYIHASLAAMANMRQLLWIAAAFLLEFPLMIYFALSYLVFHYVLIVGLVT